MACHIIRKEKYLHLLLVILPLFPPFILNLLFILLNHPIIFQNLLIFLPPLNLHALIIIIILELELNRLPTLNQILLILILTFSRLNLLELLSVMLFHFFLSNQLIQANNSIYLMIAMFLYQRYFIIEFF